MEHHAEVLAGRRWQQRTPNWRDLAALALIVAVILLIGSGTREMLAPLSAAQQPEISLSPLALPNYALRMTMRMLAALVASLFFTFTYGTLAAKSRRAEVILIPLLDVLQSVPVLGYLSFTVVFFVSLFPSRTLGVELAAIFAIFTSQAWNMAFSFFQSLRTIPFDLDEASRGFRFSGWQRFWRLEVPFAMPGLVWNTMMSMSGGWFFVVASEAIAVGDLHVALPGVGSYVARAIEARDLTAVGWAILAMTVTIFIYDQLLFRPLVAWADKFRYEQTAAAVVPRSWIIDLFRRTKMLRAAGELDRRGDAGRGARPALGAVICSAARGAARSFPFARRPLVWNCPARRRLPRIGAAAICRGAIVMAGSVRRDRRWQHHFAARRRPHRHRDRHLGPGRSCRRLAPGLGGKGSAGGAVSRGISGKLIVPARGLSDRQVRSFTRDLVDPADDSRNAVVHRIQCHRRRQRLSDGLQGGVGDVPDTGMALVARCHAPGDLSLIT